MKKPSDPRSSHPLIKLKKHWNMLTAASTFVMATIGTFWKLKFSAELSQEISGFATFVVAIILGLMFLPLKKYSKKAHAWHWEKVAAVTLILGIMAFFTYLFFYTSWTVRHENVELYVGSELQEGVAQFLAEHQGISNEQLLKEFAGWEPARIWTERSIYRHRLILAGIYVMCTPLFAIAMIAVAQLIYCATRGEEREGGRPSLPGSHTLFRRNSSSE